MHVTAIRKFLKGPPKIEEQHLTTSEINSMFIKPETKGIGYPFITQYINQCDALTGKPLVQPATVFISHAWRYSFYDVVVEVMEQHACEHPDAYFWFDLFTNITRMRWPLRTLNGSKQHSDKVWGRLVIKYFTFFHPGMALNRYSELGVCMKSSPHWRTRKSHCTSSFLVHGESKSKSKIYRSGR